MMLLNFIISMWVVVMLYLVLQMRRIDKVFKFRKSLLDCCVPGDRYFWVYFKDLDTVSFDEMCSKFWIPCEKFYEGTHVLAKLKNPDYFPDNTVQVQSINANQIQSGSITTTQSEK